MGRQLPWSDELDILLLECIQQTGAHIPEYKKTKDNWDRVQEMFFNSNLTKDLQDCKIVGNVSKFQDRYKNIRTRLYSNSVWIEWKGTNKSAIQEDEPNKLFKIFRQIEFEIEDDALNGKTAIKEDKKKRLQAIETAVTAKPTEEPKKRSIPEKGIIKNPLTGEITENTSKRSKMSSFEAAIVRLAESFEDKTKDEVANDDLN